MPARNIARERDAVNRPPSLTAFNLGYIYEPVKADPIRPDDFKVYLDGTARKK